MEITVAASLKAVGDSMSHNNVTYLASLKAVQDGDSIYHNNIIIAYLDSTSCILFRKFLQPIPPRSMTLTRMLTVLTRCCTIYMGGYAPIWKYPI